MKRVVLIGIVISIMVLFLGLQKTAINPQVFSGQWYSSADQNVYLFQDGIIYCTKHEIPVSDAETISGAYFCSSDAIFLFAKGIEGLEQEKELYLFQKGDTSLLCENKDGSGQIYFARIRNGI